MIICSSNNIDFIQGVIAYGNEPSTTDWRIANSNGVLNILNSKSNNVSLSILETSNVGIGIANPSSSLDVNGDINITGIYKKNNRDVINDTSNYVLSTSNILVNRILTEERYTSNYISGLPVGGGGSSQWTTLNANIYYNAGNVGIGTAVPITKLHIYNDINETTNLTIQNNKSSQSSSLPTELTSVGASSTTIGTTERCITFPYSGSGTTRDYTFTTTEALNVDILIVGGGGAGGTYIGGGGGAGGVLYAQNVNIGVGTYSIVVGRGGLGVSGQVAPTTSQNGSSSKAFGIEVFGGGYGGIGEWGSASGRNGGSGGSGGAGGSAYSAGNAGVGGNIIQPSFTNSVISVTTYNYYGGMGATSMVYGNAGGWIGANGGGGAGGNAPANTDQANAGAGADGIAINITGTSYFWGGGGGGGQFSGGKAGNGGRGGGGGGSGSTSTEGIGIGGTGGITLGQDGDLDGDGNPTAGNGGAGTGGGGGGIGRTAAGGITGSGGSGIVIIRYRKMPIIANSSIEFIRGASSDSNMDYKIGNYNGDFKILSSTSNIDIEYFKITPSGPSIYNPTGSPNWATTSDRRIKENIEEASYDKCYENIDNLGLFRFNYIKEFNNNNKDIRQLGFIAQEVNEIFPKAVSSYDFNNGDLSIPNLLSIDITQINYSLYGAVKKLIMMNEDTDFRIKRLETLLNIDTCNISIDTSNISIDTSQIVLDTSNIATDTEQYMYRYWQYLNGYTSNLPIDTSNLPIDTSNLPIDTSDIEME